MKMPVTVKTQPRVSKSPDPAFETQYDSELNMGAQPPRIEPKTTGSWTIFWVALVAIIAAYSAYSYFGNSNMIPPAAQTTTNVAPPAATPPAATTNPQATPPAPSETNAVTPAVPATPSATTTPPATSTSP